jgi:hypothetical protein
MAPEDKGRSPPCVFDPSTSWSNAAQCTTIIPDLPGPSRLLKVRTHSMDVIFLNQTLSSQPAGDPVRDLNKVCRWNSTGLTRERCLPRQWLCMRLLKVGYPRILVFAEFLSHQVSMSRDTFSIKPFNSTYRAGPNASTFQRGLEFLYIQFWNYMPFKTKISIVYSLS